jgi:hypothetical protein
VAQPDAITERRKLEGNDVRVSLHLDSTNIYLEVFIDEMVGEAARNYVDALRVSREVTSLDDINRRNPDVLELAKGLVADSSEDEDLPEWYRAGMEQSDDDPLGEAVDLLRKEVAAQMRMCTIDGIIAAMFDYADVIIGSPDSEKRSERGIFKERRSRGKNVIIELHPEITCDPIDPGYWDDSATNKVRADNFLPPLPPKKVSRPVEQKVAWITAIKDQYPIFSIDLDQVFERYFDKLIDMAFEEARQADEFGFRSGDVDRDTHVEAEPTKQKKRRQRRKPVTVVQPSDEDGPNGREVPGDTPGP